jgi:hypothetical protein
VSACPTSVLPSGDGFEHDAGLLDTAFHAFPTNAHWIDLLGVGLLGA